MYVTSKFPDLNIAQVKNNIEFTTSNTQVELEGILALQQANLPKNISSEEAKKEGFVTVEHDLPLLEKMNTPYPHIIAKADKKVVGYTLIMLRSLREDIPVLVPMFNEIDQVLYQGMLLGDSEYVVMGQVCVARMYRGKGVFAGLYQKMGELMHPHFDYIITEVAVRNTRSMRAHEKVGFETVHEFKDQTDVWAIMLLEL